MLRQDVPSLTLWSHGRGQCAYLALDRVAEFAVNQSNRFIRLTDPCMWISIDVHAGINGAQQWRLSRTEPMAEVMVLEPGDLAVSDLDRLEELTLVLRRLGFKFDSLFYADTCGRRQLSKEQQRLSDIFQVGMWLMLEATDQMNAMGFPPSDDPTKLNEVCTKLDRLCKMTIPSHLKQAFFRKLLAHGFENLRDPVQK